MLPQEHRLRLRSDFSAVLRRGRRASRPLLTLHLLPPGDVGQVLPTRAGLVVSKSVGGSVIRSRVSRRLRHQLRALLPQVPPGTRLVVRASPAAADADSAALALDLRAALVRVTR